MCDTTFNKFEKYCLSKTFEEFIYVFNLEFKVNHKISLDRNSWTLNLFKRNRKKEKNT